MNQTDNKNRKHASSLDVVLVNYKTFEMTSLCLDLLKKALSGFKAEVWVVDNYSNDDSTEYLRSLDWIHLIERESDAPEAGYIAHGKALDMVLDRLDGGLLLVMHTDTLIYDSAIISMMLEKMTENRSVAAVGCLEQVHRGVLRTAWRYFSRWVKHYSRRLKTQLGLQTRPPRRYYETYLKSFCTLWNVDILKQNRMSFLMNDNIPGYEMQDQLVKLGYTFVRIAPRVMFRYLDHVEAGTVAAIGGYKKGHRRERMYRSLLGQASRKT